MEKFHLSNTLTVGEGRKMTR